MAYFRYKLMQHTGKVVSGIVKLPFDDLMSAIAFLEGDGNTTISVKKLGPLFAFFYSLLKKSTQKKVERKFLAQWLSNLAMMLKAGMPLAIALEESAVSSDRPAFESNIKDIILTIKRGSSFSAAAEQYPHIFPKTVLHLIRIGEESGTLDDRLKDAADHLFKIHAIISDTKQALMYPCFVILAMGSGMIFWFYFVVPKIVVLFEDMEVKLPQLTLYIIAISEFIQTYILQIGAGTIIGLIVASILYKAAQPFKKIIDYILLKIPVAGNLIQASSLAFITEYFALLLNAGIDIIQSVKILEESISNETYRTKLKSIRQSLSAGISVSDAFTKASVFPRFVCRMINIGEKSGSLSEQLGFIAEDYKNKLTSLVTGLSKTIEPLVLVVAGIMFAIIIAGLFLPVYDLVGNISGT